MKPDTDTGDGEIEEVVIYEDDNPCDLLMYFHDLPRESGVDDGSDGMEVGVWYGIDQEAECVFSNLEELEDGRVVPLLYRLATPDAQMVTEDGKRWELAVLERAISHKWRLVRRRHVDDPLWTVVKSDDPVDEPWMAFPPDDSAAEGLTREAWNRLVVRDDHDQFFGLFERAVRDTFGELTVNDLPEEVKRDINGIMDAARGELAGGTKAAMRWAFRKLLAIMDKREEGDEP
jgi:hypothetical protein